MSEHEFDIDDRCIKCGDKDWFADSKCSESKIKGSIYCPVCQRVIIASNIDDVKSGRSDSYVFVHDDICHSDTDIEALDNNIN